MEEVRRLKRKKEKNEAALSEEDLHGKYGKAYKGLCDVLEQRQRELETCYKNALLLLEAIMVQSIQVSPDTDTDKKLNEWMVSVYHEAGNDPLLKSLFLAFWNFTDIDNTEFGRENKDGSKK